MKRIDEQTYYEILEIPPDATQREIQQAYERVRETFQNDSVAIYSLLSEKETKTIQVTIEDAYRILMDENSRKEYDQSHLSSQSLKWPKSEMLSEVAESPMEKKTYLPFSEISIEIGEGPYEGKMLKQIREKMGVELKTISSETKISLKVLEGIEEEAYERLPAQVYLKGFLRGYARCLGLDPKKVIDDFLSAMGSPKKK